MLRLVFLMAAVMVIEMVKVTDFDCISDEIISDRKGGGEGGFGDMIGGLISGNRGGGQREDDNRQQKDKSGGEEELAALSVDYSAVVVVRQSQFV